MSDAFAGLRHLMELATAREAEEARQHRARLLRDCGYDIARYHDHLRSLGLDPAALIDTEAPT